MAEMTQNFDVLVIGAGLSGIAAAHYLQTECPKKSFAVLEGRSSLGGTWDLFRYPGIRSDSDMHTLGFSFHPWPNPQAIADGPSILAYLHETAESCGINDKIVFDTLVVHSSWSSQTARWTVTTRDARTGEERTYTCGFLWACTGYYRYDRGYTPDFPGVERFRGQIVHPQFWTEDIDYTDKKVIVIGSGATAVTLVPAMSARAAHVTMLQRSPTYVMSIPATDKIASGLRKVLGEEVGSSLTRWKNVLRLMFFYQFARKFPRRARRFLIGDVRAAIGDDVDVDTHFAPRYDPWDQRVCFVPDDDLFDALRAGRASVVTDHIETFTENGILLKSGEELEADLIVTATGLELVLGGGASMEVDGEPVVPADKTMYKGAMLSDVPNAAMSVGYTNASWTLKCELISEYVCRLLNFMDEHDYAVCCPRLPDDGVEEVPLIDFNSGYVLRALDDLPHQGSRLPWRLYQNYIFDRVLFRHRPIDDGSLEWRQRELA